MMMNLWLNTRENNKTPGNDEDILTAMKLIIAYSLALKNYCRGKPGLHHADLAEYLPPTFVQSFDGNSPRIPPLEVIKLLHQYVIMLESIGKLDPRSAGSLLAGVNTFTNELSNAERILTPWPLAYSIHLKVQWTLYLLYTRFVIHPLMRIFIANHHPLLSCSTTSTCVSPRLVGSTR
jgi:predicted membrane chloride channel (bestrophin family)